MFGLFRVFHESHEWQALVCVSTSNEKLVNHHELLADGKRNPLLCDAAEIDDYNSVEKEYYVILQIQQI